MPYLTFLFCEDCKNNTNLDLDFFGTIDAYKKEGRKSAFINQYTAIWDYLIYSCHTCGRQYRYTYKDVEHRVREYFCALSARHKEIYEALAKKQELDELRMESRKKASQAALKRATERYTYKEK